MEINVSKISVVRIINQNGVEINSFPLHSLSMVEDRLSGDVLELKISSSYTSAHHNSFNPTEVTKKMLFGNDKGTMRDMECDIRYKEILKKIDNANESHKSIGGNFGRNMNITMEEAMIFERLLKGVINQIVT